MSCVWIILKASPPTPVHGKIVFHKTVPAVKKVRNPWLEFFTCLPTHVNIQVSGCRWSVSRQPASTVPGTVLGIHVKQPLCFERGHGLLRGEFGSLEVVTRWKFLYRRMHGLHWVNKRGAFIWEKGEIVMDGFPDKDPLSPQRRSKKCLSAFTVMGPSLMSGWGTKIPQVTWCSQIKI